MAEEPSPSFRKLTAAQKTMITQHLTHCVCQLCGNKQWVIADAFVDLRIMMEDGAVRFGGPSVSAVYVVCTTCKQLVLLSAVELGLVSRAE